MTNFKDKDDFIARLVVSGFKPFGPGHSSKNGYDLIVNSGGRRACFCDNRLWGDSRIEFRVVDYGKIEIFKNFIFNMLFTRRYETKYDILNVFFDSDKELTRDAIMALVKTSESLV